MMLNGVIFFGHQKTFRYLKFFISTSTYETSRMISKVFIYISVNIFISLFLLLLNLFFCYSTFLSGHTLNSKYRFYEKFKSIFFDSLIFSFNINVQTSHAKKHHNTIKRRKFTQFLDFFAFRIQLTISLHFLSIRHMPQKLPLLVIQYLVHFYKLPPYNCTCLSLAADY